MFFDEMDKVVPWQQLLDLVAAHRIYAGRGRPPFPTDVMLRIHFKQQWFNLSDPAMEEALHDAPLFSEFAGLGDWAQALPDEATILRVRHKLEEKRLAPQILAAVNAVHQARGADAARRHGRRCHADRRAEFDEECQRRRRHGDEAEGQWQAVVCLTNTGGRPVVLY